MNSHFPIRLSSPEATDPTPVDPALEARREKLRRVVKWTVGGAALLTCVGLLCSLARSHDEPAVAVVPPAPTVVTLVPPQPPAAAAQADPPAPAAAPDSSTAVAVKPPASKAKAGTSSKKHFAKVTRVSTPQKAFAHR